jgi:hypothetical protein
MKHAGNTGLIEMRHAAQMDGQMRLCACSKDLGEMVRLFGANAVAPLPCTFSGSMSLGQAVDASSNQPSRAPTTGFTPPPLQQAVVLNQLRPSQGAWRISTDSPHTWAEHEAAGRCHEAGRAA